MGEQVNSSFHVPLTLSLSTTDWLYSQLIQRVQSGYAIRRSSTLLDEEDSESSHINHRVNEPSLFHLEQIDPSDQPPRPVFGLETTPPVNHYSDASCCAFQNADHGYHACCHDAHVDSFPSGHLTKSNSSGYFDGNSPVSSSFLATTLSSVSSHCTE